MSKFIVNFLMLGILCEMFFPISKEINEEVIIVEEKVISANAEQLREENGRVELNEIEAAGLCAGFCQKGEENAMTITQLIIDDFDQNGQMDMVVMVQESEKPYMYGAGCLYFYMNEDEAYCYREEEFPFMIYLNLCSADFDNDGYVEIAFETNGTGCGAAGDWYPRMLKYKNHDMVRMELLSDCMEAEIYVQVIQMPQENTYRAYCPMLDDTIVFEAKNAKELPQEEKCVGGDIGGLFNLQCVEYEGGYALQAEEYLYGEGGVPHCVALARFLIVWDKEGNSRVEKWWILP